MKHKEMDAFSPEEKEWMNAIAVNYVIAQSDGFQLGYAQAISDFTENILDYWEGSDDKPQRSIIDTLVDLGVELGNRKQVVRKNIEAAKNRGYEQYYNWRYKAKGETFPMHSVGLYTKFETEEVNE